MKHATERFLSVMLALALCLMPLACGLAEEANPGDVMVLVNGTAITREAYEGYAANLINYFGQYGYDMTSRENLEIVMALALNTTVEQELIRQKRVDLGLELTEEELKQIEEDNAEEWANTVALYAEYYFEGSTTDALALLESYGYTESMMLEEAVDYALYDKLYAYMVQGANVTDADIQALFDAKVEEDRANYENDIAYYEFMTQYYGYPSYYTPAGYRGVTHILLEVDDELLNAWQALVARLEEQQDEVDSTDITDNAEEAEEAETAAEPVTQEQVDAAKAAIIASVQPTIDEIFAKLESGTPFADLIAEYGTDPGMTVEPQKTDGYPVHMDSIIWDPAFVVGAFSVDEVGAVAQPVVGSYGVHIIQYTRDVPAGPVELTEELRAELMEEALADKESELYQQTINQWKEEAEIVYSEEAQAILAVLDFEEE